MTKKPVQPKECQRCQRELTDLNMIGLPQRHIEKGHVVVTATWVCDDCAMTIGAMRECPGEAHQHAEGYDHCGICTPRWGIIKKMPLPLENGYCYVGLPFSAVPGVAYTTPCSECGRLPEVGGVKFHQTHLVADPLNDTGYICADCEARARRIEEDWRREERRRTEDEKRKRVA